MSSDDPGLLAPFYRESLDAGSVAKDTKHNNYRLNKARVRSAGADNDDLHLVGQNLVLSFDAVTLTGTISSSIASHRSYSLYFAREKDASGKEVVLNADGYPVNATWTTEDNLYHTPVSMVKPALDANGHLVPIGSARYERHEGVILSRDALYLGDLINRPAPAVNNGVLVTLKHGTVWTVTGTSYLTGLTIEHARIAAPGGKKVEMTVNGVPVEIKSDGTYSGDVVLSLRAN
jgi:hypothetical protein